MSESTLVESAGTESGVSRRDLPVLVEDRNMCVYGFLPALRSFLWSQVTVDTSGGPAGTVLEQRSVSGAFVGRSAVLYDVRIQT